MWVQDNNPGAPERNGCIVAEGFRETHGVTPRGETLRNQVHPRGGPSEDLHTGVIACDTRSHPKKGRNRARSHPRSATETGPSGTREGLNHVHPQRGPSEDLHRVSAQWYTRCVTKCIKRLAGSAWGPPLVYAIREGRTQPAFAGAGCICASPWLPPLLSWSSLGAHLVAGDVWRPPRVGERAEGVVDGKGEGDGCFVRVYLF